MERKLIFFLSLLLLLASCATTEESNGEMVDESSEEIGEENPDVKEEAKEGNGTKEVIPTELTVLAENLSIPWSIQKEGEVFYISERTGTIAKIENGDIEHQEVLLEHEVSTEQEAGLLGFVLHPDFTENQQAFAYYTYSGFAGPTNRIVHLQLAENRWEETDILLDDIPSGAFHHGGRLALGDDEKLYATPDTTANVVIIPSSPP